MNDLINFITGGAETFTPAVMVGLIDHGQSRSACFFCTGGVA